MENHALPTSSYTHRAPSPPVPFVPVQLPARRTGAAAQVNLSPSYENVDPSQLTSHDLDLITGNATQLTANIANNWAYEQRRQAQRILDFIYLGPRSVIQDVDWLRRECITMVFVVRDGGLLGRKMAGIEKACQNSGSVVEYVDIVNHPELIHQFSNIIRTINNHLLTVYKKWRWENDPSINPEGRATPFRSGKVLVTCETGNDKSAAIVAAYIMAMFGQDMPRTLQFINLQRFSCNFDPAYKHLLQSWGDIVRARVTVARNAPDSSNNVKRGIEDTMDMDELLDTPVDDDRFLGRRDFAPFMDV